MQNGLEVSAPSSSELLRAAAFAIRLVSAGLTVWMIVHAIRWW